MNDTQSDATPDVPPKSHLGFRLAVGAVGLVLIALFAMLGSVAMKQSATQQALETRESPREGGEYAPARE